MEAEDETKNWVKGTFREKRRKRGGKITAAAAAAGRRKKKRSFGTRKKGVADI